MNNDEIMYSYTRAQAIEDGEQVCLSEKFPEDCALYKYPVYCTRRVWDVIESAVKNPEAGNDFSGVIWDLCYMSAKAPGRKEIYGGAGVEFTVIITGSDVPPDFYEGECPCYQLHSICGALDMEDPRPAITIQFPDED